MIKTRCIGKDDISAIVDIHMEAFSGFFLTTLGKSFLNLYYKSLIKSKDGVAICAFDTESNIIGFCVGTLNSTGFHKRMIINNLFPFIVQFLYLLIKKPRSIIRLVFNLEKQPIKQIGGIFAELLSIGVKNSVKGTGVGNILIQRFERELILKKSSILTLTTDYYNNETVINFYRNTGYDIYFDFTAYPNRRMYKMIKYL